MLASPNSHRLADSLQRTQLHSYSHCCRSKSRSVDHGLLMPFDLHSLRSKVEGRIEAVQNEDANSTGEYVCAVRARSPQCILRHPHLCAIVCRTQHPKRLIFLSTECERKRVARIAGGLSLATFFSSHVSLPPLLTRSVRESKVWLRENESICVCMCDSTKEHKK